MRTSNSVTLQRPRPLAESHSAHSALSSEPDEIALPGWLNGAKRTASYRRVFHVLELIRDTEQSIQNGLARGAYVHAGPPGSKWPSEKIKLQRAANKLHGDLQRALEPYSFNIRLTKIISGDWLFNMYCSRQRDDFGWKAPYAYRASAGVAVITVPTYVVYEGDAVLAAVRLAGRGILGRIRLCVTCSQKWLFAKHSNYRFCCPKCRETYYTNTEEYQKTKARQMREYRARLRRKQEAGRRVL